MEVVHWGFESTVALDGRSRRSGTLAASYGASDMPWIRRFELALKGWGISLDGNSRFFRYQYALDNGISDGMLRAVAFRELYQLLFVLETLPVSDDWRREVMVAISNDHDFPVAGVANTRGRDTLFELFVAARMHRTGLLVRRQEPDLWCVDDGLAFGVAIKRVKSLGKVVKRCCDARDQILDSGGKGLIALDISPLQDSYFGEVPKVDSPTLVLMCRDFLLSVFDRVSIDIEKRCKKKNILGVIAFASGVSDKGGNKLAFCMMQSVKNYSALGSVKYQKIWSLGERLAKPNAAFL